MSAGALSSDKDERLRQRMAELGIEESALIEKFVLGSGSGGQKINKTSSCVFLSCPAEGIELKCQRTRSLALNRYYARWELCERLAERREGERSLRQQQQEHIRRQKQRRTRRQKARMVETKRRQGAKKALRGSVDW